MRVRTLLVLGISVVLLTSCRSRIDDVEIAFPSTVECNDSSLDFVELEPIEVPKDIDRGYLYSYNFDFGQYSIVFQNPDLEDQRNEFMTVPLYGNQFHNDDGVYLQTEVPEGYYLYSITYKYSAICGDSSDEEKIAENVDKSFLYFSETNFTESEFREAHPELFE